MRRRHEDSLKAPTQPRNPTMNTKTPMPINKNAGEDKGKSDPIKLK